MIELVIDVRYVKLGLFTLAIMVNDFGDPIVGCGFTEYGAFQSLLRKLS